MAKTEHGEITTYLDDNNVIVVEYGEIPNQEPESGELWAKFENEAKALAKKTNMQHTPVLVDTRLPKGTYRTFTSEERKRAANTTRIPSLGPWAIVGESTFMKLASKFIATASGIDLKWFTDRDKAYQWLLKRKEEG